MTRNAIIVPLNPAALLEVLAFRPELGARITHVEHDHVRERLLIHVHAPQLTEVEDGSEARVWGFLGTATERGLEHPVGQVIAHLVDLGRPSAHTPADLIGGINDLLGADSLACLGVIDSPQPITGATKADLLRLAAHLVALAGITLDDVEAAEHVAIDRALAPVAQAATRVDHDE